ncbi:hypothetical protein LPTSP4_00970 [Leptospira ryugenii]|uniref:LysM domain-containing protein n=1 Tax=Leptospira ryugenii TaxID=1917863 RepID=A0A2P2DVG8_9LEPT|nr:peptidoglycan DD-metalloendopeptidase family protein [Leptospira ryugenii]GBF48597.1 hypothetical protein LPTSP4_00970 [Leptospira ryugenii]
MQKSILVSVSLIGSFLFVLSIHGREKDEKKAGTYRVQAGDSWYSTARKFNLDPKTLASWNGRTVSDALYVDETIRVKSLGPSSEELKEKKPPGKPNFPLSQRESIKHPFSDTSHIPHKGVEFTKLNPGYVRSTLPGKVINIDYMDGYDNFVILEHQNGWYSVYGNLERVYVNEGQNVEAKQRLGSISKNKGLYFQVNQNKSAVNPIQFFQIGSS